MSGTHSPLKLPVVEDLHEVSALQQHVDPGYAQLHGQPRVRRRLLHELPHLILVSWHHHLRAAKDDTIKGIV